MLTNNQSNVSNSTGHKTNLVFDVGLHKGEDTDFYLKHEFLDQLGRDLGVEDRLQDAVGRLVELVRADRPADQILDQRLGHAGIDAIMAHLVADAVGRPAQRDLAKVAGADDEAAVLVGEPEQIVGAKPRLHILEGDVVDRLALGEGVADVGEHLPRGRPDVDLLADDAQRVHQRPGIALGLLAGGEAGHGEAQDRRARQARDRRRPGRRRSGRGSNRARPRRR